MASEAAFALSDAAFREKVQTALQAARRVLGDARAPLRYAGDAAHAYGDKFAIVAAAVGAAAASELAALRAVGLSNELLTQALEWQRAGKTVTLQLDGAEHCTPMGHRTRVEESPNLTETVTEERSGGPFGFGQKTRERSVSVRREVKEWVWAVSAEWKLRLFTGAAPDDAGGACVMLAGRASEPVELVTGNETSPRPKEAPFWVLHLDVTWLLRQVEKDMSIRFEIDRAAKDCHTPARNAQVSAAVEHFQCAAAFAGGLKRTMRGICSLDPEQHRHAAGWVPGWLPYGGDDKLARHAAAVASGVYIAVPAALALADGRAPSKSAGSASPAADAPCADVVAAVRVVLPRADSDDVELMSDADMSTLLGESMRSLESLHTQIGRKAAASPRPNGPCSAAEVWVGAAVGSFLYDVATSVVSAVSDVEDMLRRQVAAAVGRTLTEQDFTECMAFHCRSLFGPAYRPRPFCYAVRRPGHAPEGELSICGDGDSKPIETMVATRLGDGSRPVPPMHVKLSASARLAFTGDRYVHGIVRHAFSSSGALRLHLRARARQFSCFVLVAGTITAADEMTPVASLLVRDKDDLDIPLVLDAIPTQKEFRDAIESLSPEQQEFCKGLRAMQLASTLFGVAVIQVKPQLERLLNLPPDALTKEIKLTRDLMTLFTKYQMPSDLLSYGGDADARAKDKMDAVRSQVAAMNEMIAEEKKAEADEAVLQRRFEKGVVGSFDEQMDEGGCRDDLADLEQVFTATRMKRSAPPPPPVSTLFGGAPAAAAQRVMARGAPQVAMARHAPVPANPPVPAQAPVAAPVVAEGFAAPPEPTPAPQPVAQVGGAGGSASTGGTVDLDLYADLTTLPSRLDAACAGGEANSGALRATIIKPADVWSKASQPKLLGAKSTSALAKGSEEEKAARAEAFGLLDALSQSGELEVSEAELHVVLAATHCFDDTLMDTLVKKNVNPIAKVERSCVSMASVIHGGLDPAAMLPPSAVERLGIESS